MISKSKFLIIPFLEISLLLVSSLPIGTSSKGMFGILESVLSNFKETFFWFSDNFSISIVISLDLSNNDLSFFFDISFFSFSNNSFFWIKDLFFSSKETRSS